MIEAFSSMEYPHWLIVAGAVLLVIGFMGMALRQRVAQAELKEMANGNEQGPSEFEAEPAQTQAADRKARLAELRRERWANRDRGTEEEPSNDSPKVVEKKSK